MMKLRLSILLILIFVLAGCGSVGPGENPPVSPEVTKPVEQEAPDPEPLRDVQVKLVEAYPNLSFTRPVEFGHAGDGSGRVFVVEKTGKILVFQNDPHIREAGVFLDLTDLVDSGASEKGLLGLAFHPAYSKNGYFYVNYTNRTSTVIARYEADPANFSRALPDSGSVLLTIPQPYANHNGGRLDFGPDGYLYIATGDGGSGGDPRGNAQNRSSLLGKILRIDVDNPGPAGSYGIPVDNPWAGNKEGFREEIYAYGLRNPWKFSFDREQGRLWAADVGQDRIEEINIIEKGGNYGWNIREGSQPFAASAGQAEEGLVPPIWEYRHALGNSITGGYVYAGERIPGLKGAYVYGDFGSGLLWALWLDNGLQADNRTLLDTDLNISTFGLDQDGELYILDYRGKIYILTS
ncbi:MAG: PQQ-dependent sugar dehydrogenase [Clostridia bacterium]|jgi:glucose/arabinose dehydrogenase|nr:PQQ-dependent sugar dehydrogenase [Clostridia bacterium]